MNLPFTLSFPDTEEKSRTSGIVCQRESMSGLQPEIQNLTRDRTSAPYIVETATCQAWCMEESLKKTLRRVGFQC